MASDEAGIATILDSVRDGLGKFAHVFIKDGARTPSDLIHLYDDTDNVVLGCELAAAGMSRLDQKVLLMGLSTMRMAARSEAPTPCSADKRPDSSMSGSSGLGSIHMPDFSFLTHGPPCCKTCSFGCTLGICVAAHAARTYC